MLKNFLIYIWDRTKVLLEQLTNRSTHVFHYTNISSQFAYKNGEVKASWARSQEEFKLT